LRYFASARESIRYRRCRGLSCSAVRRRVSKRVAIELCHTRELTGQCGRRHGVLVEDRPVGERGEAQAQRLGNTLLDDGRVGFDASAQHDGAPCAAPARWTQGRHRPVPASSGIAHSARDGLLDLGDHAQLDPIGDPRRLGPCHVGLGTPVAVAANARRQAREQPPRAPHPRRSSFCPSFGTPVQRLLRTRVRCLSLRKCPSLRSALPRLEARAPHKRWTNAPTSGKMPAFDRYASPRRLRLCLGFLGVTRSCMMSWLRLRSSWSSKACCLF
jgi:hypothetical protein